MQPSADYRTPPAASPADKVNPEKLNDWEKVPSVVPQIAHSRVSSPQARCSSHHLSHFTHNNLLDTGGLRESALHGDDPSSAETSS